jgi:hypothetical protein
MPAALPLPAAGVRRPIAAALPLPAGVPGVASLRAGAGGAP